MLGFEPRLAHVQHILPFYWLQLMQQSREAWRPGDFRGPLRTPWSSSHAVAAKLTPLGSR